MIAGACRPEPELPVYWQAPDFQLIDERGQPFSSAELRGRVALADFIYTSCADVCPILSATMRQVQDRLKADGLSGSRVILLSFTVDPERDSPEELSAYGQRYGADPASWRFLTGDRDELERTLVQGFKLPFRGPTPAGQLTPGFEIAHTSRMVLIDREGGVRALFHGQEVGAEEIVKDLRRLAR